MLEAKSYNLLRTQIPPLNASVMFFIDSFADAFVGSSLVIPVFPAASASAIVSTSLWAITILFSALFPASWIVVRQGRPGSCIYHVNGDSEEHEGGNDDQPHLSCKLQNHQVVLYFSKKLEYLSILRHPRRDKTELFTDRSKQELGRKVAQKIAVEEL